MTRAELLKILRQDKTFLYLPVYVQPGAKRSEVAGLHDGNLKIKINAPPVDGKANEELIAFLSRLLEVPKSRLHITRGEQSRKKVILIAGLTPDVCAERICNES